MKKWSRPAQLAIIDTFALVAAAWWWALRGMTWQVMAAVALTWFVLILVSAAMVEERDRR